MLVKKQEMSQQPRVTVPPDPPKKKGALGEAESDSHKALAAEGRQQLEPTEIPEA